MSLLLNNLILQYLFTVGAIPHWGLNLNEELLKAGTVHPHDFLESEPNQTFEQAHLNEEEWMKKKKIIFFNLNFFSLSQILGGLRHLVSPNSV